MDEKSPPSNDPANSGPRRASIDPVGSRTTYVYNADGRLTSVIPPAGKATTYEYDPRPARHCQGYSRREFLRVGSLALGGLTLANLLGARAATPNRVVKDRSVVLLFLQGGPSQIELFDPKMTAPEDIRSITGEVPTKLPGVTFVPVRFTPRASRFANEPCGGVHVLLTDWRTFEPVGTGVAIACTLRALFADAWDTQNLDTLLKHRPTRDAILATKKPADAAASVAAIVTGWRKELDLFRLRRKPFLLYE